MSLEYHASKRHKGSFLVVKTCYALQVCKESRRARRSDDDVVDAVEPPGPAPVPVRPECDGHLVADAGVPQGGDGRGRAAVHPALAEGPQRGDNQVVTPVGGAPAQATARLQLEVGGWGGRQCCHFNC